MTRTYRRSLSQLLLGSFIWVPLTVGATSPPPDSASTVILPSDNAFSYSANGKDATGPYHILTYYLTGREQTGKSPKVWVLIARPVKPNSNRQESTTPDSADKYYAAEKLQVDIDCKSLSYTVVTDAKLDSNGKTLSERSYPENSGMRRLLPDKRNHSLPKREDVPAMTHAMTILDESCYPFE